MFKKDYSHTKLLEKSLDELEKLNYSEQFLDLFPDFFVKHLPVSGLSLFMLNRQNSEFIAYHEGKNTPLEFAPVTLDSNLVIYLKNLKKPIVIKDESPPRIRFLKKTNPDLFEKMTVDVIIPLFSIKDLYGFVVIAAGSRTYKELEHINGFFKIFSNILIPLVIRERIQEESGRNYYKIYRMDRLALVGELAASAAHEIKNPLAGISTFLKYFTELKDFKKKDIIDELEIMKQSVQRIDEIVKSLLSFSRFKKKKIVKLSLSEAIDSSLHSIAIKIPAHIKIVKKIAEELIVETDLQHLQQVLVNILFNAAEAIGNKEGEIIISTYPSGGDQLPSRELFNISIKDNGPGIDDAFKEKLFQPFQTTKEEGTGLGLYTCYGLMKSLGGNIKINGSSLGTEVILSLPYSYDDEISEE
jgi:signal transduction histidine kinase